MNRRAFLEGSAMAAGGVLLGAIPAGAAEKSSQMIGIQVGAEMTLDNLPAAGKAVREAVQAPV